MDNTAVRSFIEATIKAKRKEIQRLKDEIARLKKLSRSEVILMMPLSEFDDFPARALNALNLNFQRRKTPFTLYDLTQMTERELLKCRNLGKETVRKIKRFLSKYRLQLKPENIS